MKTQFVVRASVAISVGIVIGSVASARVEPTQVNVTINKQALTFASADAIAKELLTSKSYSCLKKIIYEESRGNPEAANSGSSAKGIGQLLQSTYRNIGMKHSDDEAAQLVAMLAYIGRKYGSGGPCAAWKFHSRHDYY